MFAQFAALMYEPASQIEGGGGRRPFSAIDEKLSSEIHPSYRRITLRGDVLPNGKKSAIHHVARSLSAAYLRPKYTSPLAALSDASHYQYRRGWPFAVWLMSDPI